MSLDRAPHDLLTTGTVSRGGTGYISDAFGSSTTGEKVRTIVVSDGLLDIRADDESW